MSKQGRKVGSSEVFWELVRDGPKAKKSFPHGVKPYVTSLYDIRSFDIGSSHSGGFPRTCSVVYLNEYHDPEDVVDEWSDFNEDALERYGPFSQHTVHMKTSNPFTDVVIGGNYSWVDDDYAQSTNSANFEPGGTCPICKEEYPDRLPNHLRNHCSES